MENSFNVNKSELLEKITKSYYELVLPIIASDDKFVKLGIKEGADKFLSNAYINSFKINTNNPYKKCKKKWLISDFISNKAKIDLNNHNYSNLRFDHIVPKELYQNHFKELFKNNPECIDVEYIKNILKSCWVIATVTNDEHINLHKIEKEYNWTLEDYINNYSLRYITFNSIAKNEGEDEVTLEENTMLTDGTITFNI